MELHEKTDEEIRQIATPIMDNLMDGANESDWKKHTLHFTEGARAGLTESNLLKQCESYHATHGYFENRNFLGITRHPDYVNILWSQTMTRTHGEYFANLTLVEKDNEYQVIRCWVDLWDPKGVRGVED